ncbi:nucleolar pre-ribosomal-associated protein 1 [Trichonephila clavata]|uniref:Nucleolar pre-ribosomal-associated protein 1 n=1 Tax=Trichonephila clavata TaxID=2740835 RepID=A0A8X6LLH4_TRICU|nr:nucleolar pre-ribosomal-associated protein 1 [Trichonephila clavata]
MERVLADKIQKSLQQKENIYIHLQHLINQAEEFYAKNSNYDVIKEYLLLSGNCQELLQFIKEVSTWDTQNAMFLFKALSYILIRTVKDLDIYSVVGTSIANEILSYGMRTMLNFLKVKQKSSRVKSALHLLTSMVALGGQVADQVVAKLNFANTELFHLLGRTNFSEDEDIRTAFLNLIILIVTVCNKNVIRKMVETKGFFNLILHGLLSDRVSTIILVLDTLRVYVIEEPYIPQTIKLNLFNDHSLKPATQLYLWKGPLRRNDRRKRKFGGKEYNTVAYEISDEEAAEVRSCVHKFLLALLCSHKHGIIFSDPTCGVKGRNNNPVITNVLKSVPIPYCDPLVSDLVISVFQASPDQLKFYFPMFKDNFIPRLSLSWLKAIDFLKKVIKSLNPVSVLFKTDIKRTIPVLANIAKIFCLLDVVTPSDISEAFLNGHRVLCYHICSFLLSILTQVKIIIDYCDHFEFSNFLYDPSEMSAFKKSFLSLIFPSLPAMDKIHHYWNRVTSEATEIIEDKFLKDLPIPKLFEELLPLIEVIKLYKIFSCKLSRQCDLDVPLLLNNLKKCSTVLSHSDQSKIYLSVIDIFSEQYNATPWTKQKKNNSPIIMILEVYLAAHRSGELVGARSILHKILLSTKIFDDCLWEIDLWLDAVECAKSQDIPVIFAVINEAIHSVLNESTKIVFENKECIEKSNIKKTDDSSESETTCKESSNEKKLFSKFVFAVLENLKFLEKSKRKGCQIFVEKALDPLMHYQHSAKFYAALEPYKSMINPAIYDYWRLLFSYSSNIEVSIDEVCTGNTSCNLDLIDHLRQNFISYHSSAVEISLCDISNLMGCLSKTSVRKVIWQLLMYIDFEAKLILRNESQNSSMIILDIQFLEEILTFFPLFKNKPNCNSNEDIKIKQCNISTEEMDIMKDLLKHPILLKLFLFDMNAVENSVECVKNVTVAITKFVLNIAKKISNFSNESLYSYLTPFKKKILKFFQKAKMHAFTEDIELSYIVGTFILFFGFDDIQIILQTLLNVENTNFQNFDAYFPTLCLLIQIFIEKKEFVLLSSTCINALISAFASSPKKRKKVLGQYIYQLLLQHPIYAFLFTEDSMMILLQHSSIQDLNILGVLIDYSNKFRQITQTFISDSLEEANTVKFLYLASKCLCNAEKENKSETEFKDLIFSRFFDTFKEFVLSDLTNDLDILHNCTIGKSVQVLLQDKENSKILRHFCKSLMKNHSDEVPSVSKMHAILQLFHSWKLCSDNNKTRLRILKVCFLWLSTGLNTDFKNLELTNFIKEMIENMDCLEIDEVIDVTDFFQKSLKFALKSDDIGKDILKILCLLCEKSKGNHLPVQCIHGLVCGHSCFLKIMLTEKRKKYFKRTFD